MSSSTDLRTTGPTHGLGPILGIKGKEGEEDQSGGGWIALGTTCRRENCQGRTRKTGLDGGVSQDTSTPHKSGKR